MTKDDHYYRDLLTRYLENRCSPKEYGEVMDFLKKDSSNRLLLHQIKEQFHGPKDENSQISVEQSDRIRGALLNKIVGASKINEALVITIDRRRKWQLVAVAAAIIMIIGISSYFMLFGENYNNSEIVKAESRDKRFKNDVLPGEDKAVLTLADGSTIMLDDVKNGILTQQGNTKVIKLAGKLAYDPADAESKEVLYNSIVTPRGGQYQIELPDGSLVWLNAASSLRFPTAFIGKDRRVEITGEAYFEVTKNKSMPFIVNVEGSEIQVLGTHFNVMAYKEESYTKTTLLEGSVKFVHGNISSIIKPGQQTQLANSGQFKVLDNIDTDAVIAWKNGNFDFDGVDIETVMRQLSRWYNVEVKYNKKTNILFYAEIPRNTKLSEVLQALEYTSKVKFVIDGKKIVVM